MKPSEKCKAQTVREALGLTPTEAGVQLLGYTPKQAYDTWTMWENGTKKPSRPTEQFFNVLMILIIARDVKTRGAAGALDLVLDLLRPDK